MDEARARGDSTNCDSSPTTEKLERLFDLSLDMLCVAGLDGYFKHISPAFHRTLGYRDDYLLSREFIEFVHPDDRDETINAVQQLAEGRDIVDFENRYRAADGTWRWLAWRSTSVPDEGLIYATARDVTEHKKLQALAARQAKELERSNADLQQFASVASHDLQAPLRAVGNLAGWIEEELSEDASREVRDHLHTLRERVDLMTRLVTDLLAYASVGRDHEIIARTDTAELVKRIIALIEVPDGFEVVVDDGLPTLQTVSSALEQVLRNLIGNAIDHHDRDHGTVRVSARDIDGFWQFTVADDGPGIPVDQRKKVFEMLWSAPPSGKHGTGMGLALVKRIVERFGGSVQLEHANERGTSVQFTWPKQVRP